MSRIKKGKKFTAKMSELPNLVDALFEGNHAAPGWVFMNANVKGRECINALFPKAHIAWRESDYSWAADWQGFELNLPGIIAATETKLPLEITRGADLDEARPAALAFLLACGVIRQGGRSAVFEQGSLRIYDRSSNLQ